MSINQTRPLILCIGIQTLILLVRRWKIGPPSSGDSNFLFLFYCMLDQSPRTRLSGSVARKIPSKQKSVLLTENQDANETRILASAVDAW